MMTTTVTSYVPAVVSPDFDSFTVRQAIAGFLAGYGDATRQAYALDMRQWLRWCDDHELRVFEVRRAHIELFGRSLEADGKAKATVARRLSTVAGFYRYCFEEGLKSRSPAARVRRHRVDRHRSTRGPPTILDRRLACTQNELARVGTPTRTDAAFELFESHVGARGVGHDSKPTRQQ